MKIFKGEKRYEFRKAIFKQTGIKHIIVYASAPISKVIGEFEIEDILCDDPGSLWLKTYQFAGVDEDYFNEYFSERAKGYAIKIKKAKLYQDHICIRDHFGLFPPQSFAYVTA